MNELLLCRVKCSDNVGSIYRLAYQFGIRKIWTYQSAKPSKANTYKTERHIEIEEVKDVYHFLRGYPHLKIALETKGFDKPVIPDDKKFNFLIGVGNESHGFGHFERQEFDHIYTLKSNFRESYNVSHALGIALYNIYFN